MATPKRKNDFLQERVVLSFDHPAITSTTAWKFFKVPAGRALKVDAIEYLNPTGLATDASNYYTVTAKADIRSAASLNTNAVGGAAIVANTFTTMTPSATPNDLVAASGEELSLTGTKTGTQTLPAGRVIVHARYIQ